MYSPSTCGCACNPSSGEEKQEGPGVCKSISLAETFEFQGEKPVLQNKVERNWRRHYVWVSVSSTYTPVHTHKHTSTHTLSRPHRTTQKNTFKEKPWSSISLVKENYDHGPLNSLYYQFLKLHWFVYVCAHTRMCMCSMVPCGDQNTTLGIRSLLPCCPGNRPQLDRLLYTLSRWPKQAFDCRETHTVQISPFI